MYTYKDNIVKSVIQQLEGLSKLEVYDLCSTLEALLLHQTSLIEADKLIQHYEQQFIAKRCLKKTEKGCYYLYDRCLYIKVYKYHSFVYPNILFENTLYFTLSDDAQNYSFTKENLLTHLTHKTVQAPLAAFLVKYKPTKRNPKTKRLFLMDLLDMIAPE